MKARNLALLTLIGGCYTGAELCAKHKWGHTHTVQDNSNDGLFDGTCKHTFSGVDIQPALPQPEEFHGTSYVSSQDDHVAVKRVINAITVGDWEGVSENDIDVYIALVSQDSTTPLGIVLDARNKCLDWLINEEECEDDGPGYADTVGLCNTFVRDPIFTKLTDLSGCLTEFPISEAPQYATANPATECDYLAGYTDDGGGSPMCVADGTTAGDEGGDTTGSPPEDFGDLEMLVSCAPYMTWEQYCQMDQQLLLNVAAGFRIFYDEAVWLEATNIAGVSRGVQISGVDANEETEALLDAFGLQDGDLLTHVNFVALNSEANIANAIHDFETGADTSWVLTVRRQNGMTWDTLDIYVSFPVSSP